MAAAPKANGFMTALKPSSSAIAARWWKGCLLKEIPSFVPS
jgi:hypothetical protein